VLMMPDFDASVPQSCPKGLEGTSTAYSSRIHSAEDSGGFKPTAWALGPGGSASTRNTTT
jgi:hypothetical protein